VREIIPIRSALNPILSQKCKFHYFGYLQIKDFDGTTTVIRVKMKTAVCVKEFFEYSRLGFIQDVEIVELYYNNSESVQ